MNDLLKWHYKVQEGMFFDHCLDYEDWTAYLSDIITDGFWNYAILRENTHLTDVLPSIKRTFLSSGRTPSVYIVNEKEQMDTIEYLKHNGFVKMSEESFMVYKSKQQRQEAKDLVIRQVRDDKTIQDFIRVFMSAYCGERTPEQPYGELDKTYIDALTRSFSNSEKFIHYICYCNNIPLSVATLCIEEGKGGIYNVGTLSDSRSHGYGTAVTNACIYEWSRRLGEVLFLQTEAGSTVEKWYRELGFETAFSGSVYCME